MSSECFSPEPAGEGRVSQCLMNKTGSGGLRRPDVSGFLTSQQNCQNRASADLLVPIISVKGQHQEADRAEERVQIPQTGRMDPAVFSPNLQSQNVNETFYQPMVFNERRAENHRAQMRNPVLKDGSGQNKSNH